MPEFVPKKKAGILLFQVFCNSQNLDRGLLKRVLSLFLILLENWTSDKRQFIFRMPICSG